MPTTILNLTRTVTLIVAGANWACGIKGTSTDGSPPVGKVYTAQDIADTGASNAWDAVKLTVRSHYFRESMGEPVRVLSKRGQGSIALREDPVIVVNKVIINDVTYLKHIPANQIVSIRVLNQRDAATYYGMNSVGGAIILETMLGNSS